jgi:AcrR family transcriptional regulator
LITQRENTRVRQKQIVSAAKKLIVKNGSEYVTVRRIAKEIGVSEGAIYRHFVSKKEILSFILDDVECTLSFTVNKNDFNNHDELTALENLLRSQLSAIQRKRGVTFQIIAEIISLGDKDLSSKAYEIINSYIILIKDTLTEGVKSKAIKPNIDLGAVSMLLFGLVQGLVTMWTLSRFSIDLEQKFDCIWEFLRDSIGLNPEENPSCPDS